MLFFFVVFMSVIVLSISSNIKDAQPEYTNQWEKFVIDVWEECFTQNNICKNVFSSYYINQENSKKIDVEMQHFSDQILFHRARESMDAFYSSYTIYQLYEDVRDGTTFPNDSQFFLLKNVRDNIKNFAKITDIWFLAIDNFQSKAEKQLEQSGINNTYEVMIYNLKLEMAKLISQLQIQLFTKELALRAIHLPHHVKNSPETKNSKTKFSNGNSGKRNLEEEQTSSTITGSKCSPNKYPVWNQITRSYDCICYSDKNCLVDIMSVSVPDTIHPILIIVLLIIVVGIIVRIYQSSNPIF